MVMSVDCLYLLETSCIYGSIIAFQEKAHTFDLLILHEFCHHAFPFPLIVPPPLMARLLRYLNTIQWVVLFEFHADREGARMIPCICYFHRKRYIKTIHINFKQDANTNLQNLNACFLFFNRTATWIGDLQGPLNVIGFRRNFLLFGIKRTAECAEAQTAVHAFWNAWN